MNTSEIEALFVKTNIGDYEADDAREAISILRQNGDRAVFDRTAAWCHADEPRKRARAVAILCQLQCPCVSDASVNEPGWLFRDEAYALVTEMLEHENDSVVLDSAISALGHLGNPTVIPRIVRYQDHADENVRFAAAFALGCFPNDEQSVSSLLKLTTDPDSKVRDWAVFGLGVQGDADSADIREALLRCLEDPDEDVREEAAVGLGKRRGQRLIPKLLAMLEEPELKVRVAEAAAAMLGLDRDPDEWVAADYRAALLTERQVSN